MKWIVSYTKTLKKSVVPFLLLTFLCVNNTWAEKKSPEVGTPKVERLNREKTYALSVPFNVLGQGIGLSIRKNVAPSMEYVLTGFLSSTYTSTEIGGVKSSIGITDLNVFLGYRTYKSYLYFSVFQQFDLGLFNRHLYSSGNSWNYVLGLGGKAKVGAEYHIVEQFSVEGLVGYGADYLFLNFKSAVKNTLWDLSPFTQLSVNYYW